MATSLCGTHALERVGKIKSQTIQKGGVFFYSEDEKGVLVKRVEQGWDLDHTSQNFEVEEWYLISLDYLFCCLHKQYNILAHHKMCSFKHSGISYSISSHLVLPN